LTTHWPSAPQQQTEDVERTLVEPHVKDGQMDNVAVNMDIAAVPAHIAAQVANRTALQRSRQLPLHQPQRKLQQRMEDVELHSAIQAAKDGRKVNAVVSMATVETPQLIAELDVKTDAVEVQPQQQDQ
jgi:hypothetical protein